eukprot:gene13616-14250_t
MMWFVARARSFRWCLWALCAVGMMVLWTLIWQVRPFLSTSRFA